MPNYWKESWLLVKCEICKKKELGNWVLQIARFSTRSDFGKKKKVRLFFNIKWVILIVIMKKEVKKYWENYHFKTKQGNSMTVPSNQYMQYFLSRLYIKLHKTPIMDDP